MFWISKIHQNSAVASFIIPSRICSTKQIFKPVSNVFKFVYFRIKNFHKNVQFGSSYNNSGVFPNSDTIIQSLNNIDKEACSILGEKIKGRHSFRTTSTTINHLI